MARLTWGRREAHTSFVKERFVNQNGCFGPVRQGKCYAYWAFNFIRLVVVGQQHLCVEGIVLQVNGGAFNVGVGSVDVGQEKVGIYAFIRSSLKVSC